MNNFYGPKLLYIPQKYPMIAQQRIANLTEYICRHHLVGDLEVEVSIFQNCTYVLYVNLKGLRYIRSRYRCNLLTQLESFGNLCM